MSRGPRRYAVLSHVVEDGEWLDFGARYRSRRKARNLARKCARGFASDAMVRDVLRGRTLLYVSVCDDRIEETAL